MMAIPRIIVVDDQYGGARSDGRNRLRENFCLLAGIRDITGDVQSEEQEDPVAEAVFCRGQVVEGGGVRNDIDGVLKAVRRGWDEWPRWAMLLLDLHFKTGRMGSDGEAAGAESDRRPEEYFGLAVLERLWSEARLRDLPIILLSSMQRSDIEHRFASGDRSVAEFMDKSILDREHLAQALWNHGLIADDRIVGHSIPLLKCLREARSRAKLGNDTILLLGETGTGKELLARYVHEQSPRADRSYVTVYTQGVPETLVEDRLFGHERGAYSGATSAVPGAAEDANGGTLFIDEFGDVPAAVQSKLLRLLDKNIRETQRLGAREARKLDLQVVLATNRLALLSSGDFRQDLLYRAKADEPVVLPRLQDRSEDIPLLAEHFVRKYEAQFRDSIGAERREVAPDAMDLLCSHSWPGNIRQLERVIESAVYRWPKLRTLSAAHLSMPSVQRSTAERRPVQQSPTAGSPGPKELVRLIDAASFDPAKPADWAGLAPDLREAFARAYAKLLRAALVATRKPTPAHPEGEIKVHPAMKLVTGDSKLTATKAADAIKRILSVDRDLQDELLRDPVLAEAYEIAVKLRPKGGRRNASRGKKP